MTTRNGPEPDPAGDRDRLVAEHGHLVGREVARYRTWRMEADDLRQAGLLGLLIAAARFEPGRGVPFGGYAQHWVRKEIQRAIAAQEFPCVLPPDLPSRAVALRRVLDDPGADVELAAVALGVSVATVTALRGQLDPAALGPDEEEELAAPGYVFDQPEDRYLAASFVTQVRAALRRMDARQATALILRHGLDGGPERSFRQLGRELGVSDHTARNLVERARQELRRLLD